MIRLHPIPACDHTCPYCEVRLEVKGWYVPGVRNLADLGCPRCGRKFYGDLPSGHGLYYPMLLDQASGIVHDNNDVGWFADWLRVSYANRKTSPVGFSAENFKRFRRGILLNCLDGLYGHCLLKLLNAQYYLDQKSGFDLILLIPQILRWLVPDGVAAIWTVDLPLRQGIEWNDWLAVELRRRVAALDECWLSVAFPHPHPKDFNIQRFTGVAPFLIDKWEEYLKQRPTVTFIWREDRLWCNGAQGTQWVDLKERIPVKLRKAARWIVRRMGGVRQPSPPPHSLLEDQKRRVVALARTLLQEFPRLDFAVAGLGQAGGLPDWIVDLRYGQADESVERAWCARYAKSHVVIGVHGSNMLLPSAHAGAIFELVPNDRWGNLIQDVLIPAQDVREMLLRCRFVPLEISVTVIAEVMASLLRDLPFALLNFKRPWCDHEAIRTDPWKGVQKRRETMRWLAGLP